MPPATGSPPSDAKQERLLNSFRFLCNNDGPNKQLSLQDVEEVKSILKHIPTPLNVNSDPGTSQKTSLPSFTDRFKERLARAQEPNTENENEATDGEAGEGHMADSEGEDGQSDGSGSDAESVQSTKSRGSQKSSGTNRSRGSQKSRESRGSHGSGGERDGTSSRKRRPETYEQRRQKQNFLRILRKLEQEEKYHPTQDFTMEDSLQDIKDEVEQYYMCKEATSFVSKWKNNVEMGAGVLEVGVQLIPKQPLKLRGLKNQIRKVHESKQVDIDWERIYYSYRRKKAANPFWSLAMTYGFAMLSTQFNNFIAAKFTKVVGGDGGSGGGGGGAGGDAGLGGIDLGGIIQTLFSAFGSQPSPSEMPSMTSGLPGSSTPFQGPSTFQGSTPNSPQTQQAPQPRRPFKRTVFF